MTRIHTKRVYDSVEFGDGIRFLVVRLWPPGPDEGRDGNRWLAQGRGNTRAALRRWYCHDPVKRKEL